MCRAVTARAVVASKKVVSDTIVFNHSADYIPRVVNILDPLFLAHTKDGSAGKAFIKGFHISLTLTRNVLITIPPDDEPLYDITVRCRIALISSKTLEENFRSPWMFHPERAYQHGFDPIKAKFNTKLHTMHDFPVTLHSRRQ